MFMHNEWKSDPKMKNYLRPETIFRASKFEDYYAKAMVWKKQTENKE
jgi:uncharacterized phage protein (TIGR02220 family)